MLDIDNIEKLLEVLEEYYPYDKRVEEFKKIFRQIKKRLDILHNKIADFLKKENIKN